MKFNKTNPLHILIYIYGSFIFYFVYLISKVFAFPTENNIVLYGHKYYGNLKSLYENLDIKDYSKFFITLDYKNYKKLKNQSIDVLYGLSIKDTIKIIKSKIYVTDHGLHFYKPLLNNDNKLFFDVNHGLPFQKWNSKLVDQWYKYKEVWLFSSFHKSVYQNEFGYEKDNLYITGYGRLDKIKEFISLEDNSKITLNLKQKYNIDENKKIILYAPTWIHKNQKVDKEFMLPTNPQFLHELNNIGKKLDLIFIFRPHMNTLFNTKFLKKLSSLDNVLYFPFSEFEASDEFLIISDMLITDWSSIAFDYILLDRPTLFLDILDSFQNGTYNENLLRFGIRTNRKNLGDYINKYLLNIDLYFDESKHNESKNVLYDNTDDISSNNYVKRIEKYI